MSAAKLADVLGHALADAARDDPRVFVLDGDLADSDGAMHFAERHPERFLMAGIAEQGMVSTAAGMADSGLRPWVFSFAAFLCYRALDQVRICLSQSRQPVVLVGSHAGGLSGRNGKTHAAPNDLAVMMSLPALAVFAPADAADARYVVGKALELGAPSYIRTPRRLMTEADNLPGIPAPHRWVLPRQAVTLVACGLASQWAFQAAQYLRDRGIVVGLMHCLQLKPFPDFEHELADVQHIFCIEDHSRFGGLASLLAHQLPARHIHAFGWSPEFSGKSAADDALLERNDLTPQAIADAIIQILR